MTVFKFSKTQQSRLIELYHDTSIPSKELSKHIADEMDVILPYDQVKQIYNDFLNLPLRKRARKEKIQIVFENDEEEPSLEPLSVIESSETENW